MASLGDFSLRGGLSLRGLTSVFKCLLNSMKCYFLLAETQKKQKIFSHTPWGLFNKEQVVRVFKHMLLLRLP